MQVFIASSQVVAETAGNASITIVISPAFDAPTQVPFVVSGSASPGVDYELPSGTISFLPGQTSATITVQVIDDSESEAAESIVVTLLPSLDVIPTGFGQHLLTIFDDESIPSIQFGSTSSIGSEAAGSVAIIVTLTPASVVSTTIPFTIGGTTTNADRTVSDSPLVFAAGQTRLPSS